MQDITTGSDNTQRDENDSKNNNSNLNDSIGKNKDSNNNHCDNNVSIDKNNVSLNKKRKQEKRQQQQQQQHRTTLSSPITRAKSPRPPPAIPRLRPPDIVHFFAIPLAAAVVCQHLNTFLLNRFMSAFLSS